MKDAAVETLPGEGRREDAVSEAIDTYVKAKKQLGFGGLLPPDVFFGLKFSDKGTATTEVRKKRWIYKTNVIQLSQIYFGSALVPA